ncbi:uncharacterized protein LOC114880046 [Osmia bicornis bicornis]|uniref:uncharacterized protein LOC114880046 n=1 Tax=Osmia bicornis bicornis TaxID=1437191 RepID=UPI001EAF8212|nr:uncharacterized protein LOC114880046 [Osmia bicornis bicornis]
MGSSPMLRRRPVTLRYDVRFRVLAILSDSKRSYKFIYKTNCETYCVREEGAAPIEDEVQIVTPEAVEDEVAEQSYMGQDTEMLEGEPGPSTSTPLRPTRTVAAKRRHTEKEDHLERAFFHQILEIASDPPPEESQHFANFVAAKMRNLNNSKRVHVQARIMQLSVEIEARCTDNI